MLRAFPRRIRHLYTPRLFYNLHTNFLPQKLIPIRPLSQNKMPKREKDPDAEESNPPKRARRVWEKPEAKGESIAARNEEELRKSIAACVVAERETPESEFEGSKYPHPLKVMSWNVNGLRAIVKRHPGLLRALIEAEDPDVLFLEETKMDIEAAVTEFVEGGEVVGAGGRKSKSKSKSTSLLAHFAPVAKSEPEAAASGGGADDEEAKPKKKAAPKKKKVPDSLAGELPEGYTVYWCCATSKKGYSGTCVFIRDGIEVEEVRGGMGSEEHDSEGRVLTCRLGGPFKGLHLVGTYTPNSGQDLKRLEWRTTDWDVVYREYIKSLGPDVVVLGDLNVAPLDYDVFSPGSKANKTAGFCDAERENFGKLLETADLTDVWRDRHPGLAQYTFFSMRGDARGKNNGWHIDFALTSKHLAKHVRNTFVRPQVYGSDHVPIGLIIA